MKMIMIVIQIKQQINLIKRYKDYSFKESNKQAQSILILKQESYYTKQLKMYSKVYSQSLKKLKKQQVFDYSIDKIQKMQKQIKREEQLIQIKQKPIKNYIQARKQLINHKISKNKLQEEVDNIMKQLIKQNKLSILNHKINHKYNYQHYRIHNNTVNQDNMRNINKNNIQNIQKKTNRILTQPNQSSINIKKNNIKFLKQTINQQEFNNQNKLNKNSQKIQLPKIKKSASQGTFQKSKSRKLKTQHELIQRLNDNPKNKLLQYINIDTAIRQYRSGMTSLIRGVYYNPHNPYKNSNQ